MTDKILYALVTCSMDQSRSDLAIKVVKNLLEENKKAHFASDLLIFDNCSKFNHHLDIVPKEFTVVKSNKNIGYWSAINWILNNYEHLLKKKYKYIYLIESDLIHYNIQALKECELFLDNNFDVGGVRTQKFSVRFRWLFDKKFHFLPFVFKSSLVSQINPFTNQKVWFEKVSDFRGIYKSNFHAKLPALNRIKLMKKVFSKLVQIHKISELDFMRFYFELNPIYSVLDRGIFYQLSSISSEHVSGSWSSDSSLVEINYKRTRNDRIIKSGFLVENIKTER
jgi:hypothetical protein